MRSISPPGSVHALDLDGLRGPDISFYSARTDDGTLLGVGAWKRLDPTHGEIKSMHVAALGRRQGTARIILERLVADARAAGVTRLSLETGSTSDFLPARTLYANYGFEPCGPFATYTPDAFSAFMRLDLAAPEDR